MHGAPWRDTLAFSKKLAHHIRAIRYCIVDLRVLGLIAERLQELFDKVGFRRLTDLLHGTNLLNAPVHHDRQALSQEQSVLMVVGHKRFFLAEISDVAPYFLFALTACLRPSGYPLRPGYMAMGVQC